MNKRLLTLLALTATASAAPLINEIHFHPQGAPAENPAQEWIEIYNPDAAPADVSGWRLTKGVSFTIPAATTIPAGGFLVIAADVAAFDAAHSGFTGTRVGGWVGRLANGGEQIQLDDALGAKVNDVTYADEGDWALRVRGALSFSHRGWEWVNEADGGGKTLELRNPALGNARGQNWGVSAAAGGSPGAVNSLHSTNVAPLIKDAKHRPEIPSSAQATVVSCDLEDEAPGATATLHWRLDGAGAFATLPMSDTDADGDVEASIPAQANLSIIEWYISATDGVNTRTWPAAARTSNPGVLPETFGQATNALVLVDNSFSDAATFLTPATSPVYRIIMTAAERDELVQIGTTNGQEDSLATFNTTFISHDGTGVKSRHNAGTRNRGGGDTALGPPNNYSVSFRSDETWNGRGGITINAYYPHSQALGNSLFTRAGIATQEAAIVRVRVNGVDMAESGARMLGRYVRLEGRNSEWAARHHPGDSEGNFYRLDDHFPGVDGTPPENLAIGELRYEGTNPANYADTYFKETNQDANDYSDLINFTRILSAPATGGTAGQPAISDAAYPAAVATVLDVDHFYRFIAADALIGNQEGGLQSGRADDVSIYRGVLDTRFRFVPHDMDDVFNIGIGAGDPLTRSLFSYDEQVQQGNTGVVGLRRMFNHPALLPRYYAAVLDGLNTWFNHATLDPIIDQIMQGWVPAGTVTNVKGFIDSRRANVLAQIQQNYSLVVTTAGTAVDGNSRTTNGAATFSGTFNVARTYSITVNGVLATWSYRNTGTAAGDDDAGEWFLTVPAGGGGVLSPGLNTVVVRFWGGINATGSIVQELTAKVLWQPVTAVYTNVSGTLAPSGSLAITAPATYIPGVPFLVRVDLKDGAGNIDRTAWNRTATLSATGGITLTPSAVTLTNGMGSALVTIGGGGTTTQPIFSYGTGGTGSTTVNTGTVGSTWKYRGDFTSATLATFITDFGTTWKDEGFDDSSWPSIVTQAGYGDGDENRAFARTDYSTAAGTQSGPVAIFRNTFNVSDVNALSSVTGQVRFDDSCVVYVNGTQVFRHADMSANAPLTEYTEVTTATTRENATANITVPVALLHNGTNTIAVEVHQHDAGSSDLSFDLRLQAEISTGAADPGNFTLTAAIAALNSSKAITSLTPTPAMTNVAGTLPSGVTNWSGVMNVTGDVTVPADGTLNIAAGTHILVAGDATADSSAGTDIIVTTGGVVNATGTAAQPISITASTAGTRWGEINVNGATTTWQYCLVSRACHSPGGGHTGKGPAFRLSNGANWTFEDGAITDLSGKTLTNTGNTTMTMRRSHFARCVMGPETDGSTITIEDSNFTDMLPIYREAGGPDDEDCIYIHDSGGRPVNLRRSVFSNAGDDGIDLLAGSVTVEDCIVRNILDKGMSLLQNNVTVRRTQIIDCDFGISTKTQLGSEATPYTLTMENCTIVSEVHPTNQGDQSGGVYWHSVGVHVRNKYGTAPNPQLFVVAKNCIISAVTPMLNDYPIAGNDFPLLTSTYNCYEDVAGSNPVDPAPPTGTGDIAAVPLFVDAVARDFHLQATSPARDTGDPASPLDSNGSRADMGALPFGATGGTTGALVWTPAGGPYRLTANATVPNGLTLTVQAGTAVYFDQNVRLTVNGNLQVLGTPDRRVTFSSVPGEIAPGDADPIKLGTQTGPPKWGGIRIYDSMAAENVVKYADFINGQGTSPSGSENYGSLGFIRSWGYAEGLTFAGTHLRMLYGRNSKLTFIKNIMPDMFIFDPVLGRIEEPTTDFIAAADNSMEPMKVEFPTTDAEVSGANAPNFPNGLPLNGHWRVYYNSFHGNRGHQDVFDCDSGRWAPRDPVTNLQSNGQFVIDCRYNHFFGLAGDEHMDLGGDAYIASNVFENATKDFWTNDTGYSNAISSGDKGTGTTIMVVRNICFDMDHVINLKANTATIFEHNTVADFNADFQFVGSTVTQNVICAPINFYVPGDGAAPSRGDGAYVGFNIISNVPHVFSSPDQSATGPVTTKIEFFHNLLDQIGDPNIGQNHPGGFFSGTYGPNTAGAPGFVNPAAEDYSLTTTSLARRSTVAGFDFGASIPEWAYVVGGPVGTTDATSANFTVGGPGIVAYKWRLNGGAWSAPIQIGDGGLFSRTNPCVRQATLALNSLTPGTHTLEVLGQDMAGNWQDNDPARTIIGAAQAAPTSRTWTVETAAPLVRISEVLASGTVLADTSQLRRRAGQCERLVADRRRARARKIPAARDEHPGRRLRDLLQPAARARQGWRLGPPLPKSCPARRRHLRAAARGHDHRPRRSRQRARLAARHAIARRGEHARDHRRPHRRPHQRMVFRRRGALQQRLDRAGQLAGIPRGSRRPPPLRHAQRRHDAVRHPAAHLHRRKRLRKARLREWHRPNPVQPRRLAGRPRALLRRRRTDGRRALLRSNHRLVAGHRLLVLRAAHRQSPKHDDRRQCPRAPARPARHRDHVQRHRRLRLRLRGTHQHRRDGV
jgi:CotH kinase protein/Lamin Tail Domain